MSVKSSASRIVFADQVKNTAVARVGDSASITIVGVDTAKWASVGARTSIVSARSKKLAIILGVKSADGNRAAAAVHHATDPDPRSR